MKWLTLQKNIRNSNAKITSLTLQHWGLSPRSWKDRRFPRRQTQTKNRRLVYPVGFDCIRDQRRICSASAPSMWTCSSSSSNASMIHASRAPRSFSLDKESGMNPNNGKEEVGVPTKSMVGPLLCGAYYLFLTFLHTRKVKWWC